MVVVHWSVVAGAALVVLSFGCAQGSLGGDGGGDLSGGTRSDGAGNGSPASTSSTSSATTSETSSSSTESTTVTTGSGGAGGAGTTTSVTSSTVASSTVASSSSATSSSSTGTGCGANEHSCNGSCEGNTPDTGCSSSTTCAPCSPPQNGTAICTAQGTCDFTCNSPFTRSGNACTCSQQDCCTTNADCSAGDTCNGNVCGCDSNHCELYGVMQGKICACISSSCVCTN